MQLVDVLVEECDGPDYIMLAKVVSQDEDIFMVQYLEYAGKNRDGEYYYKFNETVDQVHIHSIDGFYDRDMKMSQLYYHYDEEVDGYIYDEDDEYQEGDE